MAAGTIIVCGVAQRRGSSRWEQLYTSTAPEDPLGSLPLAGISAGDRIQIPLDGGDWLNTSGYTQFRLYLSGDEPTGNNWLAFAAFGYRGMDDTLEPPLLTVTLEDGTTQTIPFSAWRVGRRAPAETASRHTLEDVANRELRIVSLTDGAVVSLDVY
jgi:hypothetical protein